MKIVFATHNKNKLKEVQGFLPDTIELLSLEDIDCKEPIEETENTLEGNAALKASYVFEKYGYPCFADDTGLEVVALDGKPGIYSARFAGANATDADNRKKLLEDLSNVTNKTARFRTVIALQLSKEEIRCFEGICEGEILEAERGDQGFGYDSIFQPKGYDKSFAEMDLDAKNVISHRGKAIKRLASYFKNNPL